MIKEYIVEIVLGFCWGYTLVLAYLQGRIDEFWDEEMRDEKPQ